MNLVSLLIAPAIVSVSIGDDANDVVRIGVALVATAIIAVALVITKRRPVSIGEVDDTDDTSTPASSTTAT